MIDNTNTLMPLEEWPLEELAHLEYTLCEVFNVGVNPGDALRRIGVPNMAAWYDSHLETIDGLLRDAGVPPATGSVRPYRHLEMRLIEGGRS